MAIGCWRSARTGASVAIVILIVLVSRIGIFVSTENLAGVCDVNFQVRLATEIDADLVDDRRTPVVGLDIVYAFLRVLEIGLQTILNRGWQRIDSDRISKEWCR